MKRIDDNNISISERELIGIAEFIRAALYREWDQYTNNFITSIPQEEGMRSMNPAMYDLANNIDSI